MSEALVHLLNDLDYSAGDHRLTCGLTILDHTALLHHIGDVCTCVMTSSVCTTLDKNAN